jgi:DNA repair ATPase RecN
VKRIIALTILMFAAYAAYPQAKPNELTPKDTPASQTLNQLAKDKATDQKVWDTKLQQARFGLDQQQKTLNDQLQTVQKDLNAKLQADKKYKPLLDQIADTQKKINEVAQSAQANFMKDMGSVQQKLNMEATQAQGLVPVIKKENNFPDNATYDLDTQKWTVPASETGKAPETKK